MTDAGDETTSDKEARHVFTNDVLAGVFVVGFHAVLGVGMIGGTVSSELLTLLLTVDMAAVGTVLYWAFGEDAVDSGMEISDQ